jgi:hypothetical protein
LAATANQTGKPNNKPIQVSRSRAVKIKKPHNRTNASKIEASDRVGKEAQIMIRNYSENSMKVKNHLPGNFYIVRD